MFLQETHWSVDDEKRKCNDLNGNLCFSNGKPNSCGVVIGYVGSKSFVLANQTTDKIGRFLLIEAIIDDVKFVLINIYNSNTESQQLLTLTELHKILQTVDDTGNKIIIIGGDFNFHFNSKLESKVGKSALKEEIYWKNDWTNWKFWTVWYLDNLKSNRETFYVLSKPHFKIHTVKAWFFFSSLICYKNQWKILIY